MLSVASPRPLWGDVPRSLREMTRLAVAALALATGFGGVTVASAAPAAPPAPSVLATQALSATGSGHLLTAHLTVPPSTATATVSSAAVPAAWDTASAAWDAVPADRNAGAVAWSTAADGVTTALAAEQARSRASVTIGRDAWTVEAARDATTRRGPPSA